MVTAMADDHARFVLAPKEAVGDDHLDILEWLVPDGTWVTRGTVVALAETSKAAVEIESDFEGYLFHLAQPGDRVAIGTVVAIVSRDMVPPERISTRTSRVRSDSGQTFTQTALTLIQEHKVPREVFAGKSVVRGSDVREYLAFGTGTNIKESRKFGQEILEPSADWDAVLTSDEFTAWQALTTRLRRRLRARFDRHVPLGTLMHDRWDVARECGFGDDTSVYDECLILGDVKVGKNCWIGPFTVLDGRFASLRIGDHTSIGTGAQVYSHNTIDRTMTEGQAPVYRADTVIGRACFISPLTIVGPG
jgi:hypothetical protein